MKKLELNHGQKMICDSLSEQAKDRCSVLGFECRRCEPRHFTLIVFRFDGKLQGLGKLMDACFTWMQGRGMVLFTPARFGNWCEIELSKQQRRQSKFKEMDQLKKGNQYQRAEYARRVSNESRLTDGAEQSF